VTRDYRNGTTAAYSYNANNWVTSLNHSNGPSLIAGFNYAYDNDGNKLYEQKLDVPANSGAYIYDAVNRLTNYDVGTLSGSIIPSPTLAKSWNLDPVGNWNTVISNAVPQVRTHGPANELLTDNGSNYLYDADGNLVRDNSYNYSYDEENRLTQVQRWFDSAIVGQYSYDALSRRVVQIADPAGASSTSLYYYDGLRIIEEQNPGGATIVTYTYGNYIDEALTMDRGGQTYYYHQNTLWSPHALTDASGNVMERYAYDAYGYVTVLDASYSPAALNAWGTPHSAVGNPYLFTGRELDEEAGLYFYRARYYYAAKGRFLQRDVVGYVDGMNLYEYTRDNPERFLDPTGNTPKDKDKKDKKNNNGCKLPDGCKFYRGGKDSAEWLWCYVKGWRTPAGVVVVNGADCSLTGDQIKAIGEECKKKEGQLEQMKCAVAKIKELVPRGSGIGFTSNVCRNFAKCYKHIWEGMGHEQTFTTTTIDFFSQSWHSFNVIETKDPPESIMLIPITVTMKAFCFGVQTNRRL
jgi:RHS repeat-associated protein